MKKLKEIEKIIESLHDKYDKQASLTGDRHYAGGATALTELSAKIAELEKQPSDLDKLLVYIEENRDWIGYDEDYYAVHADNLKDFVNQLREKK